MSGLRFSLYPCQERIGFRVEASRVTQAEQPADSFAKTVFVLASTVVGCILIYCPPMRFFKRLVSRLEQRQGQY